MNKMTKSNLILMTFGLLLILSSTVFGASSSTTATTTELQSAEDQNRETPDQRAMKLLANLGTLNRELSEAKLNPNGLFEVMERVENEKKDIAHKLNNLRAQTELPLEALIFLGTWFFKNAHNDTFYSERTLEYSTLLFNFAERHKDRFLSLNAKAFAFTLYYAIKGKDLVNSTQHLINSMNAIAACHNVTIIDKCVSILKRLTNNESQSWQEWLNTQTARSDRISFNKTMHTLCIQDLKCKRNTQATITTFKIGFRHLTGFLERKPSIAKDEYQSIKHSVACAVDANPTLLQRAPAVFKLIRAHKALVAQRKLELKQLKAQSVNQS